MKTDPFDFRNEGSKLFRNGAQLFQILILLIVSGSIRIYPDMTEAVRNVLICPGFSDKDAARNFVIQIK